MKTRKTTKATKAKPSDALARSSMQRRARRILADALLAGQKLSNMAFNLKQRATLPEDERACLESGYKEWDEAKRKLPKWMRVSA